MSRFSQGFRTAATATGPVIEFIAGSSDFVHLVEIGLGINAATVSALGIGYPAAKGVTPTSPVTFLSENPSGPLTGLASALAWATAPTSPAYFFRRATLGILSDRTVWTFPKGEGIVLLPSTSLVVWLFATGAVLDGWAVFED